MNEQVLGFANRYKIIGVFILIFVLGFIIRFYQLGKVPAGLYIDEAALGYNAYSILKTGKDEFGKPWPIVFRSVGDFKAPVYTYLVVPLIPIFNLSSFTVRFPSFIFGLLTIPILYFLISRLTDEHRVGISLLSAFLLAISPWHVLFGRTAYETNVALFFYLFGVYLFYLGLTKKVFLIFSAVLFAISLSTYHSERILVPITVIVLFWRFREQLLKPSYRLLLIGALILGIIITLPSLSIISSPGFLARASGLNIFSHQRQQPAGFIDNLQLPVEEVVNSNFFLSTREFFSLYFSYFSPRYMFNLGDYGPRSSFSELPTFYFWQLPFYVTGLFYLLRERSLKQLRFLVLFLLIITPIPAAITRDPYSTTRALPLVIPQIIIISLGVLKTYSLLQPKIRPLLLLAFALILPYSILHLYSSAIVLNDPQRAKEWNYGLEQVAQFTKATGNVPVIVDNSRGEPYIQLLFFLKYDPNIYQKENFEVPLSEYYINTERNKLKKIGIITIRTIDFEKDIFVDQYLISDPLAISENQAKEHALTQVLEVKNTQGEVFFKGYRTNPTTKCKLSPNTQQCTQLVGINEEKPL